MKSHHGSDAAGGDGAAFDERLRDTLRAAATSTSADEDFVERLITERPSRSRSVTRSPGHRAWLAPLLAAAAVASIVFATLALTRLPHAAPLPGTAPLSTATQPSFAPGTPSSSAALTSPWSSPAPRTLSLIPAATHTRTHAGTVETPSTARSAIPSNTTTSTTTSSNIRTSGAAVPPTAACTTRTGYSGTTVTLCSGSAAVGQAVTITGHGLCGAGNPRSLTLIFDGPKSYDGSGGGGNEVPITATRQGFVAHYRIPETYTAGYRAGDTGPPGQVPVRPGTGYDFFTLPVSGCYVPLTVTP